MEHCDTTFITHLCETNTCDVSTIPANAVVCAGTPDPTTDNQAYTDDDPCTSTLACSFECDTGYGWDGSACTAIVLEEYTCSAP